MKHFSILCCLLLLLNVLCPAVHAEGIATPTDLCTHDWHCDEKGHYCGKCGSESEKAEHTFETKCKDASGHFDVCTVCGYTTDVSDHWESCENRDVCKECGYEGDIKKVRHKKKKIWVADGEAGCYSACSGCGRKEGETIDHEASCVDTARCLYCGFEGNIVHVLHNGGYTPADSKTCVLQCTDCGQQIVQAHLASCENPTLCLYCGYTGEIESKYHPEGKWVYDEETHYFECPTCGKYDEGKHFGTCVDSTHCGYCGIEGEFNDGDHMWETVEHDAQWHWFTCVNCKKGIREEHSWGEPVVVEATETTDGSRTYTCGCGETKVEIIPATGITECEHDEVKWVADGANGCRPVCAKCNKVGELYNHEAACSDTSHCVYCGYEGTFQTIGHDGEYSPIDEGTCGFQCSACGKHITQTHWASCSDPTHCFYCGYEGKINKINHVRSQYSAVDADFCAFQCSACGEQVTQVHWASCADATHCLFCGYEGEIKCIYHASGKWVYDEESHYLDCPACGKVDEGKHFGTCVDSTHCGYCGIEGEFNDGEHVWNKIDHDDQWHWYTCGECFTDVKEEHTWGEPVVVQATSTASGSKTYTCQCGATKVETIPATRKTSKPAHTHTWGACTPAGSSQHTQACLDCSAVNTSACTLVNARFGALDASACIYCGCITWSLGDTAASQQNSKPVADASFALLDAAGDVAPLPESVTLAVYEAQPDAAIELDAGARLAVKKALTVVLLDNGAPYTPENAVMFSIPMADDLTGLKLLVVDENGQPAEIAYQVTGGIMTFETSTLGIFLLVEEA